MYWANCPPGGAGTPAPPRPHACDWCGARVGGTWGTPRLSRRILGAGTAMLPLVEEAPGGHSRSITRSTPLTVASGCSHSLPDAQTHKHTLERLRSELSSFSEGFRSVGLNDGARD
eukprot:1195023-Prorocentrum_minimum.AAC.8